MKKLADLHEVFVGFNARRIEGASLEFYNGRLVSGLTKEEVLFKYSYVVGDAGSSEGRGSQKIFQAERYGGDGILRNGGGGRCGFDGEYQLKGIGPNELVSEDAGDAHGNGFLSLESAIYESIWAEIINIALPYGAVRTVAVINTWTKFEQHGVKYWRGLLVREPAVRPAHFIRALYFKERFTSLLSSDAKRVRSTVQRLAEFLPFDPGWASERRLDIRLHRGLVELTKRYARQFAAARAKRIIHYNVSASNLSIDGGWMDLSGAGVFSQLILGDKTDIDRFLNEYLPALNAIRCICYNLGKYRVIDRHFAESLFECVLAQFESEYELQFGYYLALQVGFSPFLLRACMGSAQFLAFSAALKSVLLADEFSVFSVSGEKGKCGSGFWALGLYESLLWNEVFDLSRESSWPLISSVKLERLRSTYSALFDLVTSQATLDGIERAGLVRGMAINLIRLNRRGQSLLDLKARVSDLWGNKEKSCSFATIDELTSESVFAAAINYGHEEECLVPFWEGASVRVFYDIRHDCFQVALEGAEFFIVSSFCDVVNVCEETMRARLYYKPI
ncbi:hypothetical protein J3P95_18555 [Pseudomonas sp. Z5-35]